MDQKFVNNYIKNELRTPTLIPSRINGMSFLDNLNRYNSLSLINTNSLNNLFPYQLNHIQDHIHYY